MSRPDIAKLCRETDRRAQKLGIHWGSFVNISENARVCTCLGWHDLAVQWRQLL